MTMPTMNRGIYPALIIAIAVMSIFGRDFSVTAGTGTYPTIQSAASVAIAGDNVIIHAGTYRETVKPANSGTSVAPITFKAASGESVFVSGCDLVTGWQQYQGGIYKAPTGWTMGMGRNQVFVNRVMMMEARYPNGTTDLLHPKLAPATTNADNSISFGALNQAADFWKGAIYWGEHSPAWAAVIGQVGSSSSGKLQISQQLCSWWFASGGQGCVIGVLGALDTAGEFFNDGTNLFLFAPGGVNPSSLTVEAKRRALAFDCAGRSYITISGVAIRGATVDFGTSNNCRLEYSSVLYPVMGVSSGDYDPYNPGCKGGVALGGNGNTVFHCEIAYSAHCGVVMFGTNQTVQNCIIHDVDWVGSYAAAIDVSAGTGCKILQNSLFNTGRAVINLVGARDCIVTIKNNEIHHYGYLTDDLGAIYGYHCNGQGSEIAYNWVHDNMCVGYRIGIYLDNVCGNFKVYRNVIWNCPNDAGVRINLPQYGTEVYNNSLFNTKAVGANSYDDGSACPAGFTCTWKQGNNYLSSNPANDFMNSAANDFRPKSSAMIDKGTIVAPYTDGYKGSAPDLGAYESGGENWTAGHDWSAPPVAVLASSGMPLQPSKHLPVMVKGGAVMIGATVARVVLLDVRGRMIGSNKGAADATSAAVLKPAAGFYVASVGTNGSSGRRALVVNK